jgi:hypothetical protein
MTLMLLEYLDKEKTQIALAFLFAQILAPQASAGGAGR